MSSCLLNKPVRVEFGGSLINGQVYFAKHIVPMQSLGSVLCLLQLPAMPGKEGALAKVVPVEGCLGTMSFFDGSCGSSPLGQTEAAVTHLRGNICVSEHPNLCKAGPNLSTAFDYQLDLSHAAVKKTIHFGGARSLGAADSSKKTCGQLVGNSSTSNSSCRNYPFSFDCCRSTRNPFFS